MESYFDQFRAAVLDLIALRQSRLVALYQPDPDLEAALEDLETIYVELLDKSTPAERLAIGAFLRDALEVHGSPENVFHEYPDVAGLLY